MKAAGIAALSAILTLALCICAALTVYTVIPEQDRNGFLIVSRAQAKECAEGSGCNALSGRQMAAACLAFISGAMQQGAPQTEAPKQKDRSDI
jgi:hypothetical protein